MHPIQMFMKPDSKSTSKSLFGSEVDINSELVFRSRSRFRFRFLFSVSFDLDFSFQHVASFFEVLVDQLQLVSNKYRWKNKQQTLVEGLGRNVRGKASETHQRTKTNTMNVLPKFFSPFCLIFLFLILKNILCFLVKNDFRQKIYLRFFSEKQDAVDVTSFFLFYLTHFSKIDCLFSLYTYHQNWPLEMLPFCLLSILCFVVKNDFR